MLRKYIYPAILLLALLSTNAFGQYNKDYFFYVGRNFMMDNRYHEAIETLNTLLKSDPDAYEGYFWRGVAKYNLGDFYGAEDDFTTAISKNPVYTGAYHFRAITRSRIANYDDALTDFQEAIDLRPDRAASYYSRAVTYLMSQQFEKAIADFDEYIKFEPKAVEGHLYKGVAYAYLGDTVRAFENFNRAIGTNTLNPDSYNRRGTLYMMQEKYNEALADFNRAIECDSTYSLSYFYRALANAHTDKPVDAIKDLGKVIEYDSTMSVAYFNRAIIRSQIGDYNNALDDYNRVSELTPNNVLVYYNRAALNSRLGNIDEAINDYTKAIVLYPDFANAYLGRAALKYQKRDMEGSIQDKEIADLKVREYSDKLADSTFSAYADTSRQFNALVSFNQDFSNSEFGGLSSANRVDITLRPLFRFTLVKREEDVIADSKRYRNDAVNGFISDVGLNYLVLTNESSNLPADSLMVIERNLAALSQQTPGWRIDFSRGVTQYLIRQYTYSVNNFTRAIEEEPSNPFIYINRSSANAEMIDYISSMDNSITLSLDSDSANKLRNTVNRTYNYDEAIADLNKAAKLMPELPHIYYNRGNLYCLSGNMPAAIEEYTRAIELYPNFAEAYYNRGLLQIYLKDTKKGLLDISKAGELGMDSAYEIIKRYGGRR